MADCGSKGTTFFQSRLVFSTTNVDPREEGFNNCQLQSPAGVVRRISFPLDVVKTEHVDVENFQNLDRAWMYGIVENYGGVPTSPYKGLVDRAKPIPHDMLDMFQACSTYVRFNDLSDAIYEYTMDAITVPSLGSRLL